MTVNRTRKTWGTGSWDSRDSSGSEPPLDLGPGPRPSRAPSRRRVTPRRRRRSVARLRPEILEARLGGATTARGAGTTGRKEETTEGREEIIVGSSWFFSADMSAFFHPIKHTDQLHRWPTLFAVSREPRLRPSSSLLRRFELRRCSSNERSWSILDLEIPLCFGCVVQDTGWSWFTIFWREAR